VTDGEPPDFHRPARLTGYPGIVSGNRGKGKDMDPKNKAVYHDGDRFLYRAGPTTAGGAHAEYFVKDDEGRVLGRLNFQHAPVPEAGVVGLTNEVLLAVVIDRLRAFRAGDFPCKENEVALAACEIALSHLEERSEDRLRRDVEGEMKP